LSRPERSGRDIARKSDYTLKKSFSCVAIILDNKLIIKHQKTLALSHK